MKYLLTELYQKLDAVSDVIQFEHVSLKFEIEKNFTHDHLYAKIENLIVKLHFFILAEHVEFKMGLEHSLKE